MFFVYERNSELEIFFENFSRNIMPQELFLQRLSVFRGRIVPDGVLLAGYSALIHAYDLHVPEPRQLSGTKRSFANLQAENWSLYSPRHQPDPSLAGHLTFALRYEPLDLLVLKTLFQTLGPAPIEEMVRSAPNGRYTRRAWFLYEWLLGQTLDLPDAGAIGYVDAIDVSLQIPGRAVNSRRHRVRNNLPGIPGFCPIVTMTPEIEALLARDLAQEAAQVIGPIADDVLARAAAFLLLKDSKSTYAIEGERPPHDRIHRWGQAVSQAGRNPLSNDEFVRLQQIVITDPRFTHMGYRYQGGFVGNHDRQTRAPLPEHISARHEDLSSLMDSLIEVADVTGSELDPIISAAMIAFGFVYIHPFADGNGRIHRYLMHHILAASGFSPAGMTFPISSAIEQRIETYVSVLRSHSERIFEYINWRPTADGNVEVLNETADLYRYFDATPHALFLLQCVAQTIEHDLPEEVAFLQRYDSFERRISAFLDMPDSKVDLLFKFLSQNDGALSRRAQDKEFSGILLHEVEQVEQIYAETFGVVGKSG